LREYLSGGSLLELFIFARFHARAGPEIDVRRAIETVVLETGKEAGCLSIAMFGSIGDPRLFFIHSRWCDEAAFEAHAGLPHTVAFVDEVTPLIEHKLDVVRTRQIS
jgi:quinol monooxygenase YgiN